MSSKGSEELTMEKEAVYEVTSHRICKFAGPAVSTSTSEERGIAKETYMGGRLMLLKGFFSPEECAYYRKEFESMGLRPVHESGYRDNFRNNERVAAMGPDLAAELYQRVLPFLDKEMIVDSDNDDLYFPGCKGTWSPRGCNDCFRFCRYQPGGHFSPHVDGEFIKSTELRSMKTMMIYLNGDFSGGFTNMLDENVESVMDEDGKRHGDPKAVLLQVRPEEGMAIVFDHKMLHEGTSLLTGYKYILRTEILYERHAGSAPTNEVEEEFLRLFYLAGQYEAQRNMEMSIQTYKQCVRLDPKLAAKYGL